MNCEQFETKVKPRNLFRIVFPVPHQVAFYSYIMRRFSICSVVKMYIYCRPLKSDYRSSNLINIKTNCSLRGIRSKRLQLQIKMLMAYFSSRKLVSKVGNLPWAPGGCFSLWTHVNLACVINYRELCASFTHLTRRYVKVPGLSVKSCPCGFTPNNLSKFLTK